MGGVEDTPCIKRQDNGACVMIVIEPLEAVGYAITAIVIAWIIGLVIYGDD